MKNITVCLLVLFSFYSVHAQFIIKGKVIDKSTGEPLENAIVKAGQKGRAAITDQEGNFQLRVPDFADSIRISFVGYQGQSVALAKQAASYLIKMEHGSVDLTSVTIQPLPNTASL